MDAFRILSQRYLCEAAYILLEYARTAMFLWMFIEGLYLHNVVTLTVFQGRFPYALYAALGWGAPVLMTVIFLSLQPFEISWLLNFSIQATWAGFTETLYTSQKCWFGYNLTPYYWILEGPRLIVILVKMINSRSTIFPTISFFAAKFHFSAQHHKGSCR